jgi:hypothetical protein
MLDNQEENPILENLEPLFVKLAAPALSEIETTWLVVAKNRRVNRDWEALMQRHPENTRCCYKDLCTAPTTRQPRRVFPLKGKLYKGAWEWQKATECFTFQMKNS